MFLKKKPKEPISAVLPAEIGYTKR